MIAETVSSGWAYRTQSGDFLRVVITDEGDIVDYEAVPLEKANWVSHDTFMSWTNTTIKKAEKKLGPLKAVPLKITCRREATDGQD